MFVVNTQFKILSGYNIFKKTILQTSGHNFSACGYEYVSLTLGSKSPPVQYQPSSV